MDSLRVFYSPYKKPGMRNGPQLLLLPEAVDKYVRRENPVRFTEGAG